MEQGWTILEKTCRVGTMAEGVQASLDFLPSRRKNSDNIFRVYQFDLGVIFSWMWTCAKTSIVNVPTAPTDPTVPVPAYKPISAQPGAVSTCLRSADIQLPTVLPWH